MSSTNDRSEKLRGLSNAPRAAYIHVPFCRRRCGYCNFTLVAGRDDLIDDYLNAIESELALLRRPYEVDTLYFGGGTPTHLNLDQFARLTRLVLQWHPLAAGYEWTVEANPADIDEQRIEALVSQGVTRLSLGGQSFHPAKLRLLQRDHTAIELRRATKLAQRAGLQVSLDLIFAVPGESLDDWSADLDAALDLAPHHVSTYGLTFEEGTEFWNQRAGGELTPADESLEAEMYVLAIERLIRAGFEHYEISNFALPGCRSRHNETYWSGNGYFAAGPGAARFVDGVRETNVRSTLGYLKRMAQGESPVAEREHLPAESSAREFLVFRLRRLEGVTRSEFFQRTGYALDELVGAKLQALTRQGCFYDDGERIQLTRDGLLISDALWPDLI